MGGNEDCALSRSGMTGHDFTRMQGFGDARNVPVHGNWPIRVEERAHGRISSQQRQKNKKLWMEKGRKYSSIK